MSPSQIEPGRVYRSIHDVPYFVAAIVADEVTYRCENGTKNPLFKTPVERFAAAMTGEAVRSKSA